MARQSSLRALVKAVRRRLWLARTVRLVGIGLWVGVGLFAACSVLHRFAYALPPLYCIALALLPVGLVSAIALMLRPPPLVYAARIADHWVDGKCLLLSAWELLNRSTGAETITQRHVLSQADQATSLWRNQLIKRPLARLPNHAVLLVVVGLASGFLMLSPSAEPTAGGPHAPQSAAAALAAADRSSMDAAALLEQQLLASLRLPRVDSRPEQGVQKPHERTGASVSDGDNDYTDRAGELGLPFIAKDPISAPEVALSGELSHRSTTTAVAGHGAGAAGDLPGTGPALGADNRSFPDAANLALRYVALERAHPEDSAVSTRRSGVELNGGGSMTTNFPSGGLAPPAQYAGTPLAPTLSPALGRYATDYFRALRKKG